MASGHASSSHSCATATTNTLHISSSVCVDGGGSQTLERDKNGQNYVYTNKKQQPAKTVKTIESRKSCLVLRDNNYCITNSQWDSIADITANYLAQQKYHHNHNH